MTLTMKDIFYLHEDISQSSLNIDFFSTISIDRQLKIV